VRGITTLQM